MRGAGKFVCPWLVMKAVFTGKQPLPVPPRHQQWTFARASQGYCWRKTTRHDTLRSVWRDWIDKPFPPPNGAHSLHKRFPSTISHPGVVAALAWPCGNRETSRPQACSRKREHGTRTMNISTIAHAVSTIALLAFVLLAVSGCGASVPLKAPSPSPPPRVDEARRTILHHIESDDLPHDEVLSWIDFADQVKRDVKHDLSLTDRLTRALRNPWVAFGFLAQITFMMRFVLQIIASERKKRSYVPVAFWYLSLVGGLMLFTYALARRDPVFVFGQGLGLFIYARNLVLIYRRRGALEGAMAERNRRNGTTAAPDAD